VSGAKIDYEAVFQALPGAVMLLTPDLVIAEANEAYLRPCAEPAGQGDR
jgi:hypothetical protein